MLFKLVAISRMSVVALKKYRALLQIIWNAVAKVGILTLANALDLALATNEVSIKGTGVVVNVRFLSWPGLACWAKVIQAGNQ